MESTLKKCLVLLVVNLVGISCHPGGAPESACGDLVPQHGREPQTKQSPYKLVVHEGNASEVHLIIETKDQPFKGFMIQARRANATGQEAIGKFVPVSGAHTIDCFGGYENTLTHSNRKDKDDLHVSWLAPKDLEPDTEVVFFGTVLQNARIFWTKLESKAIKVGQAPKGTDQSHGHHDGDKHKHKVEDKSLLLLLLSIVGRLISGNS